MAQEYKNGVYEEQTNEEYHASKAISRSNLCDFKRSPLHYWWYKLSGQAEKTPPTPAMIFGELLHTVVLEPHKLVDGYRMAPQVDRRTNAGKEAYKAFEESLGVKKVITENDYTLACDMAENVINDEIASRILHKAKIEHSIYFEHKKTGLQCKVRPDIWQNQIVGDLKTTMSAAKRAFQRSAWDYSYYLQGAMIHEGLASIGVDMQQFIFIAVEKEKPHALATPILGQDALWYALKEFDKTMIQLAECIEKNHWPSYEPYVLELPEWLKNNGIS